MNLWWPTCDDTSRPFLKGAIHGATVTLYAAMLSYHAVAAFIHWRGWWRAR